MVAKPDFPTNYRILSQNAEIFRMRSNTQKVHISAGYNSAVEGGVSRPAHVCIPAKSTVYLVTATVIANITVPNQEALFQSAAMHRPVSLGLPQSR